jgi:putative transposase
MPENLVRYQDTGDLHFITFSCHDRRPYLSSPAVRDLFLQSLETMRGRYSFWVIGYVVMPEHVHLLLSEPALAPLNKAILAVKLSVARQRKERPFWTSRYYDFNVFTERKRVEKLRYMHRNPVVRRLVRLPEEWKWSSFRHYLTDEVRTVGIDSSWMRTFASEPRPTSQNRDVGHPRCFSAE